MYIHTVADMEVEDGDYLVTVVLVEVQEEVVHVKAVDQLMHVAAVEEFILEVLMLAHRVKDTMEAAAAQMQEAGQVVCQVLGIIQITG
jgi:hypothetical protein